MAERPSGSGSACSTDDGSRSPARSASAAELIAVASPRTKTRSRRFAKRIAAGCCAFLAATAAAELVEGTGAVAWASQARPNVVVIETDDQTQESMRVMASVKREIGDQGVTFRNSFVNFSLCCPSRSTFLTGQYAHNHHVLGNKPPKRRL